MIAAVYARSVVVALGLLAFATSASADCAWLLWHEQEENYFASSSKKTWTTPLAYPDRSACVAVIAERVNSWQRIRSTQQEVRPASNGTAAEFITWMNDRRGFLLDRVHCLPDTVDPRGPKSGQR